MLKFRYFYSDKTHFGFARRFDFLGNDRYLIVLQDGITFTIAQHYTDGTVNAITWYQVQRVKETMHSNDLLQILGTAIKTAEEI